MCIPDTNQMLELHPRNLLVEEKEGGHGDEDKSQGRREALAVVGVDRGGRLASLAGGRGGAGRAGGEGCGEAGQQSSRTM